jgi:fucose 4-O-acetylase-like acetyltransferase
MRILAIDFTKGILICLMVMFHLNYYGTFMPQVVDPFVYSFHVSSFMLISGFLFKPEKAWSGFWKSYKYLLLLYLLFNVTDYVLVSTVGKTLGASSQLKLGWYDLLHVIFVSPAGAYWYIHSLLWMYLVYWLIDKLPINKVGGGKIILLFIAIWAININDKLPWNIYFAVGALIRVLSTKYENKTEIFMPTWVACIPLVLIAVFATGFPTLSPTGLATVLCFICLMMWIVLKFENRFVKFFSYIGQNTLPLLLFSPFLTILSKLWHRFFIFDQSEVVYGLLSTTLVVAMCLLAAFVWDKLKLNKLFGRDLYVKYPVNEN